jgi:uncharacterized damage-inducible protein DinB
MEKAFVDYLGRMQVLHDDIADCIAGLSPEALDWVPAADMNAIGVLVVHLIGAERYWIGDVIALESSGRDRDAEFRAKGVSEAVLRQRLNDSMNYIQGVLNGLTLDDLEVERISPRDGRKFTIAWALCHALEHTALHTGHIQLTRQLWDVRQKTD